MAEGLNLPVAMATCFADFDELNFLVVPHLRPGPVLFCLARRLVHPGAGEILIAFEAALEC